MSLRRFAPSRGRKTERSNSEDGGLRGQKTVPEDRRQKNPSLGFSSLTRREAPKPLCLL
ncbi:MAG: hypothetical protein LBD06_10725 [Candidatus Accumulibacter sp.]|nr:hypothetical protein [Accumulibacter sp.]